MNRVWIAAALALLLAAPGVRAASPQPDPGPGRCADAARVEPPRLREGPSDRAIYMAYPLRAAANRLGGRVRVNCAVGLDATLHDCRVVSETPKGEGFGAHALDLAGLALVEPLRCDGRPVAGARVIVPIRFDPPPRTFTPH